MQFSGSSVHFYQPPCVQNTKNDIIKTIVDPFIVHFRKLTIQEIQKYIQKDNPLQCAGSFKSEQLDPLFS